MGDKVCAHTHSTTHTTHHTIPRPGRLPPPPPPRPLCSDDCAALLRQDLGRAAGHHPAGGQRDLRDHKDQGRRDHLRRAGAGARGGGREGGAATAAAATAPAAQRCIELLATTSCCCRRAGPRLQLQCPVAVPSATHRLQLHAPLTVACTAGIVLRSASTWRSTGRRSATFWTPPRRTSASGSTRWVCVDGHEACAPLNSVSANKCDKCQPTSVRRCCRARGSTWMG